jgi:hypothetical protein
MPISRHVIAKNIVLFIEKDLNYLLNALRQIARAKIPPLRG